MKMQIKNLIALLLIGSILVLFSCAKTGTNYVAQGGELPTQYIRVFTDSFSPVNVTIASGATINFLNLSSETHTLLSDDSVLLVSPSILPSSNFLFKSDSAVIINYHCKEHPSVRGRIQYRP
jgi:hypothetical protein